MKYKILAGFRRSVMMALPAALLASVAFAGGGSSIGPANPASLNCLKLGGTLERVLTPQGEDSNCVIEEWTLFRALTLKRSTTKPTHGAGFVPNPAAVTCIDIGGTLRSYQTSVGEGANCVIPQWTLFHALNVVSGLTF